VGISTKGDTLYTPTVALTERTGFRHEALLYAGDEAFLAAATAFIRDGTATNEPTLVMVPADKIARLRQRLDTRDSVHFADMRRIGSNPARIIPAWRQFAAEHDGQRLRGIGEPIWPERAAAELVECQRHESLLNLAFAEAEAFWLLCPYDATALSPDVIDEARRSHPFVLVGDRSADSTEYHGLEVLMVPFDDPLPEPPAHSEGLPFGPGQLSAVRRFVSQRAAMAGLDTERIADLVTAVNELATNSLLYGGAHGSVHAWPDRDGFVCEVRDDGRISDPLIGRRPPEPHQHGGRGLWMANQLCDLVQVRSTAAGTVVRVHSRYR
jgi:anti-sigma regulatory factor (Ser/Thr protein kinase)